MFCVYKYFKICLKIFFFMFGILIGLLFLLKGLYSIVKNILFRFVSI